MKRIIMLLSIIIVISSALPALACITTSRPSTVVEPYMTHMSMLMYESYKSGGAKLVRGGSPISYSHKGGVGATNIYYVSQKLSGDSTATLTFRTTYSLKYNGVNKTSNGYMTFSHVGC